MKKRKKINFKAIAQAASKATGREITIQRVKEVDGGDWQRSHPVDTIILSLLDKHQ